MDHYWADSKQGSYWLISCNIISCRDPYLRLAELNRKLQVVLVPEITLHNSRRDPYWWNFIDFFRLKIMEDLRISFTEGYYSQHRMSCTSLLGSRRFSTPHHSQMLSNYWGRSIINFSPQSSWFRMNPNYVGIHTTRYTQSSRSHIPITRFSGIRNPVLLSERMPSSTYQTQRTSSNNRTWSSSSEQLSLPRRTLWYDQPSTPLPH